MKPLPIIRDKLIKSIIKDEDPVVHKCIHMRSSYIICSLLFEEH